MPGSGLPEHNAAMSDEIATRASLLPMGALVAEQLWRAAGWAAMGRLLTARSPVLPAL